MRALAATNRFRDLPIRRKLYCMVGLLALDLAVVISIGVFGMWALSSLRAFVGGEGLWAKAQKNAVYSLGRYALSRDEKDFRSYQEHLKVTLGDRKARQELEKERPDLEAADQGFIEGGNHPDDVRGMSELFLRFRRVSYIRRAISLWREADGGIAELQAAADALHRTVVSGGSSARARRDLERVDEINARLTRVENGFSYTLGEASREAKRLFFSLTAAAALLFGGLGLWVALLIGGGVAGGIQSLVDAASLAERGDLRVRAPVRAKDEIGRLAEAFNRMAEGLSKLDQMKNDFVATASHELRTPLALTMAPLESLLAGDMGELNEDQRRMLEVMHNNVVRQLQLVCGLLDFARVEARKMAAAREPVDAAALTRSVVADFRPLARGKAIKLELTTDLGFETVSLDRYLYERILFNLLSNAIKFTPREGEVRVALTQSGNRLLLTVRDSGPGIAEADQAKLFQKFRQLDSSSTRRFEGAGLGLALVREFAALLGGGASVKSRPGEGSEFTVQLEAPPSREEDAGGAPRSGGGLLQRYDPAPTAPPPAENGPLGVLIAEDNPELASYLAGLLKDWGPVQIAADGEAALRLARDRRPELVVADVMMPRLDGLGLCRALKANPLTASIPVVLLTALTDRDSLTRGWKAGADEYLFKPFHPKEVAVRIRAILTAARARRRAEESQALHARELERTNRKVAAANDELQSFSYSVAHDLRAPLTNLSSFCSLLEKSLPPDALTQERRELLARIDGSVARMHGIIFGLLQLSRAGSQELAAEDVDLTETARAIAEELRAAQPGRDVEWVVAEGLRTAGDWTLLRVAMRNLLENAWKFTSLHPRARIEFGGRLEGGQTVFFVRDDGAGFDMARAGGLFAAFQRLHSARDFPGSGIGLATVRRIVERHGGRVWAEAAVERGTTIYFALPALTPKEARATLPA